MKKGLLGKLIAIVCVIAIVVACAFIVKTNATVDCADCGGQGYQRSVNCPTCKATGVISGTIKVESLDEDGNPVLDEEGEPVLVSEEVEETCPLCEGSMYIISDVDGKLEKNNAIIKMDCRTCGGDGQAEPDSKYYSTLMALIPALVAIALALITKEVYSSLFIGIALGGFLAANWNPIGAMDNIINDGLLAAVSGTAGIFVFLVILGAMVALINKAGGSAAFGRWAETHIKSRIGAMFATFILGVMIFIDDYFNCLTVGSVMRPVTDAHKISRAKFAFLIDATAAPICMIAPVSSWAAAVAEFTEGTGYSGIELFIRAIPYNFYSLLMVVFIITIVLMKFDYGPMKIHEFNAQTKGDLFTSGQDDVEMGEAVEANPKGRVIDLILPVVVLVITSIFGLLYVGGMFTDGLGLIDAFGNTDATVGLPWGALVALVFTLIYLMARKVVTFKEAMSCIPKGFIAMVPAILILTFAVSLKNMTGLLGAADYVAALMNSAAAGLANFLPAIIFVVACILAFSTGTSWGTFGILIPIVLSIFDPASPLLIVGVSACLAGAVCGDHCSPISDTTIMSSAGSRSNHVNHVSTQLPYAITVAAISFVTYLLAAVTTNPVILLAVGVILTIGTLFVLKKVTNKQEA